MLRRLLGAGLVVALMGGAAATTAPTVLADSLTATYTATQTIPVPPASNFAGSGGGDGWAVALSDTQVFNVFHHQSSMTVACHLQTDATSCWSPRTITDASSNSFATSGHPGLWLDRSTGKLYVYGTRSADSTGGVVCIDTALAATNPNPFCGFTALTAVGEGPTNGGISAIGAPVLIGSKWYAFNYVNGAQVSGTKNKLLCFDTATLGPCAAQPFTVAFAAGANSDSSYPPPGLAAVGAKVIVSGTFGGTQQLGCFDTATSGGCGGTWPTTISSYVSAYGAPFPLLSPTGATIGVCLPTGTDPCYDLTGASVATPAGMPAAITASSGWDGGAVVLGPRVYLANGSSNAVDCYNSSTDAPCENFPKALSNLYLMYTVNPDPQRPTCIWVNADGGSAQIQNFDAYTGGPCGQGAIRVLATSFVVPTVECEPSSFTSLQVLAPDRASYTSGSIAFQDNDAQPIPGAADMAIDNSGSIDLSGLNLTTALGLPQFVITLNGGSGTPSEVTVKLTWTGTDDESCVGPGVTKTVGTPTTVPTTPTTIVGTTPAAVPVSATPTYTG